MTRSILSLPGIDTDGQREFISKGIRDDLMQHVTDNNSVMKKELKGSSEKIEAALKNLDKEEKQRNEEGPGLAGCLDQNEIREKVNRLCVVEPESQPAVVPAEPAPEQNGEKIEKLKHIKEFLQLEKEVSELEALIGCPNGYTEASLTNALDASVTQIEARFAVLGNQTELRTIMDLLTQLEKAKDDLLLRRDTYCALSASAASAKISILYSVSESIKAFQEHIPAILDRLAQVSQGIENGGSSVALLESAKKPTGNDFELYTQANASLQRLSSDVPKALSSSLSTLAPTAGTMAQLAERMGRW
eukprot:TRINITY_DN21520_c0_g1_i1.p1 TRINITY_DN21520_c0_g1~~TRINITY_DN21520_c0_g1_i1.p1  ORF type:complete len:304 (+),score=53.09 TRINITY_DN21520_c0_g1_i1:59-970(+)